MYPLINVEKTGLKIKLMLKISGYSVRYVQEYLHLSCPQPIYRWFKGKMLPSLSHVCALSKLLGVHMEDILVINNQSIYYGIRNIVKDNKTKRILSYYEGFGKRVA